MTTDRHSYIGVAPCGCVFALAVDKADEDTGRSVGEWIADGAHVERLPRDEAIARFKMETCPHRPQWGGMRGDGRLVTDDDRDFGLVIHQAAWDVLNDSSRRGFSAALAEKVGDNDAPEAWWQDVGERLEQGIWGALRTLEAPVAERTGSPADDGATS